MLNDFGEIIKLAESIKGITVNNHSQKRYNGKVIEHILKNVCVVQWQINVGKTKVVITIEFIKDLEYL